MKNSTRLYLNVATITFGFSGTLLGWLTQNWVMIVLNLACLYWGLTQVMNLADELDKIEKKED